MIITYIILYESGAKVISYSRNDMHNFVKYQDNFAKMPFYRNFDRFCIVFDLNIQIKICTFAQK